MPSAQPSYETRDETARLMGDSEASVYIENPKLEIEKQMADFERVWRWTCGCRPREIRVERSRAECGCCGAKVVANGGR